MAIARVSKTRGRKSHVGSSPTTPAILFKRSVYMHQTYIKGKRLLLIFKDGHQELGKYRVTEKGILYFSDREPVPLRKLRSAGYYKPSK